MGLLKSIQVASPSHDACRHTSWTVWWPQTEITSYASRGSSWWDRSVATPVQQYSPLRHLLPRVLAHSHKITGLTRVCWVSWHPFHSTCCSSKERTHYRLIKHPQHLPADVRGSQQNRDSFGPSCTVETLSVPASLGLARLTSADPGTCSDVSD